MKLIKRDVKRAEMKVYTVNRHIHRQFDRLWAFPGQLNDALFIAGFGYVKTSVA